MRSIEARSTGLRRFSSAIEGDSLLDPQEEVIDIANFSGQTVIDITQINGIDITEFWSIDVVFEDATTTGSGTGVSKGVRVRTVGGSFLTTGYIDMVPGTASTRTSVLNATSASTFNSWCQLTNTNQAGIPCHYRNAYNGASPAYGRINSTMAVIDALRFAAISDASNVLWSTGKIRVIGYRLPATKISTQTFTWDGIITEKIINIPAKATFATMEVEDVGAGAGAFGMVARVGNSGTFRATADNLRTRFTSPTAGSASSTETVLWITDNSQLSQDANAEFWNLNTAAPIMMRSMQGDTGSEVLNFMAIPDSTPYSQLRLFGFTGAAEKTPTSGTVRITFYEIRNTVFTWAPDGSATHTFSGLQTFSKLALVEPTLITLGASDALRARVSGDAGASDYLMHVTTTQSAVNAFRIGEDNSTTARFFGLFSAFNSTLVPTQMPWMSNRSTALFRQVSGLRDNAQKDTTLEVFTSAGNTMNSASQPVTLVGYRA